MNNAVRKKLDYKDYSFLVELLHKNYKLENVTLSGGEPTIRKDFNEIVKAIKKCDVKVAIITKYGNISDYNHIDKISYSIETMNESLYQKLTSSKDGVLQNVKKNIILSLKKGIEVNINTVILKGINDSVTFFNELLEFCSSNHITTLKIIEEMNEHTLIRDEYYLEEYAKRVGFNLDGDIKQRLELKKRGVNVRFVRCHCVANKKDNKHYDEMIVFKPSGDIQLCMQNEERIKFNDFIKKRDGQAIIKSLNYLINNPFCPII